MDDVQMDDLLPTSDDSFEPVDPGQFFEKGSSFWELADVYMWDRQGDFKRGYAAANFEAALKSGRAFMFTLTDGDTAAFTRRAKAYRRDVQVRRGDVITNIIVSAHRERE